MVDLDQPSPRQAVERLAATLFTNPDVAAIRLADPRFRWVRRSRPDIPREVETLGGLIERLLVGPSRTAPATVDLLQHLIDYTDYLLGATLEDELLGIVATLSPARNTVPLLARFGWAGSKPVTLQEAAAQVGVTRERIRQIEQRIQRICAERPVWTPVLDRALGVSARYAPMTDMALGDRLRRSGLLEGEAFSAEGLLAAQALFATTPRVAVRTWHGAMLVVPVDERVGDDFIELLEVIRATAVRLVNNQGMSTIDEVVRRLAGDDVRVEATTVIQALTIGASVEVVDRWLFHLATDSRNPLANRLDKMLAAWPDLPIETALVQLARETRERRRYVPSTAGLTAFATWHPAYRLDDDRLSRTVRQTIEDVFSDGELAIARYILACDDPPDYTSLVRDLERPGLSRINIAVILGQSPIIHRYGERRTYRYALLGPATFDRESDDSDVEDDLADLADLADLTDLTDADDVGSSGSEVAADPVIEETSTATSSNGLVVDSGSREDEPLPEPLDGPVANNGGGDAYPPLEVALRKLLSVYSPLPMQIARTQLRRQPGLVGDDVDAEIAALAYDLEDFIVDGDRIRLRPPLTLRPEEELGRNELIVYRAIRNAGSPLRDEVIPRYYGGDATVPALERRDVVRQSCVIVALEDGRYEALRDCHGVGEHFRNVPDLLNLAERAVPPEILTPVPTPVPGRAASYGVKSAAVRERIAAEFARLAQGTGLARADDLIRELGVQRIVQVSPDHLRAILTRIDDLVELPDGWLASVAGATTSPLTRYLRRMVAVYPDLPLELVIAQLTRQHPTYMALSEPSLRAVVGQHPDFLIAHDRIRARAGVVLVEKSELARDELIIHQAIRLARRPLTEASILVHTRHGALVSTAKLKTELRESCVLVPIGDGTFDALHPSMREPAEGYGGPHDDGHSVESAVTDQKFVQVVAEAFATLAGGTSLVRLADLSAEIRQRDIPDLAPDRLIAAVGRTPHLAYLPAEYVAHIGDRTASHLTRALRKMTAVHPGLPVALAAAQLARTEPRYRALDDASFTSLIDQHAEFERFGANLVAAGGQKLIKRSELNTNERHVHDAIVKAGRPLAAAEVPFHMEGRDRPTPREVQAVLETSSVILTVGGGRYDALGPTRRGLAPEPISPPAPPDPALVQHDVHIEPVPAPAPDAAEVDAASESAPVDADHGRTETVLWPLAVILTQVGENRLVLPEIQRGYVWKTTQVRDLVDSLYRGFPIGTMLVWSTNESLRARSVGDGARSPGVPVSSSTNYLLDGQQRITSLSKVRNGELPVLFNPLREEFATATVTNRRSSLFVPVADVWTRGAEAAWPALAPHLPEEDHREARERLARLESVLNRRVPVDVLHNFSYEEVTDVFVRVNSRGTRLKAAELAIAQIAQRLPNMISDDVAAYVVSLQQRGWQFDDQFLLRCLTAVARDRSAFKHLVSMDRAEVTASWARLTPAMDAWLDLLRDQLGLTSMEFIQSMNSHVVPVAWIASYPKQVHEDRLLEWFVHSQVWSRYSGSSETALDADLQRLRGARAGNPFPTLMQSLRSGGQSARITQGDLQFAARTSAYRLLMLLAAKGNGARDVLTGDVIVGSAPASTSPVVMQQVFPSASTKRHASSRETNELPNYVLATREIRLTKPTTDLYRYLADVPESRLIAQAIPTDPALWDPARFRDFMKERRRLLAAQMNEALKSLAGSAAVTREHTEEPPEARPGIMSEM